MFVDDTIIGYNWISWRPFLLFFKWQVLKDNKLTQRF